MTGFIRRFWDAILLFGVLLGIYWMPSDIAAWRDAAEPWKRWLAMIDRETVAFLVAGGVFAVVLIRDAWPLVQERFLHANWQRPIRGQVAAFIRVVVDAGTDRLRHTERFNVSRLYLSEPTFGRSRLVFLAFELDVGLDVIEVLRVDGSPLKHDVLDRGARALVIQLLEPVPRNGFSVYCHNNRPDDLAPKSIAASIAADKLITDQRAAAEAPKPLQQLSIEEEAPR